MLGDGMFTNCKKCGRLNECSKYTSLCLSCDNEVFNTIKDYLKLNGTCSVSKISHETGIPIKIVRGYLVEGRLQLVFKAIDKDVKLCPNCGDILPESGVCEMCQSFTINSSSKINSNDQQNDNGSHGMHYFNK